MKASLVNDVVISLEISSMLVFILWDIYILQVTLQPKTYVYSSSSLEFFLGWYFFARFLKIKAERGRRKINKQMPINSLASFFFSSLNGRSFVYWLGWFVAISDKKILMDSFKKANHFANKKK